MDVTCSLDHLPVELVLLIIGERCLSARHLISLARTSHRYYRIAISPAYKRHVERDCGLASKCCAKNALAQNHNKDSPVLFKANCMPEVYWAIQNEQQGTLERIVDSGVDVNMDHGDGICENMGDHNLQNTKAGIDYRDANFSPLAWAASHGRDSMVAYLLDHGANIEQACCGLCKCYNELLRCPSTLPDRPYFYDNRDPDDSLSPLSDLFENTSDWSPLHYAICNQHDSTARLLLERGACARDVGSKVSALHVATRWEMRNIIDLLLDNNLVDIDSRNIHGVTALHMAYVAGRYDLVEEYLDKGANINLACSEKSGPWTILAMACADGSFGRALRYLRRGADPHFVIKKRMSNDRWTIMRFIYGCRDYECTYALKQIDARMALEQEIMASGRSSLETCDEVDTE